MRKGSLFVICAPSGTGKTSLVSALIDADDNLCVAVSHTTRDMRVGEKHGRDYFFISGDDFATLARDGAFLETATVYGNSYGTSKSEVTRIMDKGFDIVLEIDWQGAKQISELMPEAVIIGILPPSIESLRKRLMLRGKDSKEVIEKRMIEARDEIRQQQQLNIDYLIVNDTFDLAVGQLKTLIVSSRLRSCVNQYRYLYLLS